MSTPLELSLNEVEAMAKRATRGAGYPWGLAEEAAKATRWLCARGVDGCTALAELLEAGLARDLAAHQPGISDMDWQADDVSCPLAAGASLADMSARLPDGPLTLRNVLQPVMILPFAARAAAAQGVVVQVSCGGETALTDGCSLAANDTFATHGNDVSVAIRNDRVASRSFVSRFVPSNDAWATLERLAHKTYAPATEQSRLAGAGAGTSDND